MAGSPYQRRLSAMAEIRARWARCDLDGLADSIAGALGAVGATGTELDALHLADAVIREIVQDWVVVPRPTTLGDLWSAPSQVRSAAEVVVA